MMAFDLSNYETVDERLHKWWKEYPDGRLATEIIEATDTRFIVLCKLYKTEADQQPCATGLAMEVVSDRGVNANFALPNAETSSIGRALANAGFSAKGKRASAEEMASVNAAEKTNYSPPGTRARAVEDVIRASFAADKKEPTVWSVGEVSNVIPFAPPAAQSCKHGGMKLLEGLSKTTQKPYYGYVCPAPKAEQCAPKWAKIMDNGTYYFPSDAEEGKGGE